MIDRVENHRKKHRDYKMIKAANQTFEVHFSRKKAGLFFAFFGGLGGFLLAFALIAFDALEEQGNDKYRAIARLSEALLRAFTDGPAQDLQYYARVFFAILIAFAILTIIALAFFCAYLLVKKPLLLSADTKEITLYRLGRVDTFQLRDLEAIDIIEHKKQSYLQFTFTDGLEHLAVVRPWYIRPLTFTFGDPPKNILGVKMADMPEHAIATKLEELREASHHIN